MGGLLFPRRLQSPAQLTLDTDDLYPGASTDISYAFTGRSDIITLLEISLQVREEATYTRGSNTTTDKNVFYKLPLLTSTHAVDIRRGKLKFSIPPNVMHSFTARNNKIIWTLNVHGVIAHWPDIKVEFRLQSIQPRSHEQSANPTRRQQ